MSKIDQLNSRPPTHVLTTRVDGRYLATLVRFWHQQGELPRSTSELVRLSLETFVEFLTLNNKIDFVQSISDAQEILANTGLEVKSNPKNLAMALAAEGATFTPSAPRIDPSHTQRVKSRPISNANPELAAAQAALENSMDEDLKKRIQDEHDRSSDFKNSMISIVKGAKK